MSSHCLTLTAKFSCDEIRLVPNSRSYPLHLQIVRSLLHLTRHTETYIPISPYILPILISPFSSSSHPKSSTLRPLDFEVQIRVPQQYLKTRVFSEGLVEEAAYLLTEWLASKAVHGSIAFPEIVIPVVVVLRKTLKSVKGSAGSGKDLGVVKGLVERIEESARWADQKRKDVTLSPAKMAAVHEWESDLKGKVDESPLGKYLKVQRKTREKRRKLVEKVILFYLFLIIDLQVSQARTGEDEILED